MYKKTDIYSKVCSIGGSCKTCHRCKKLWNASCRQNTFRRLANQKLIIIIIKLYSFKGRRPKGPTNPVLRLQISPNIFRT